MAFTLYAIGFIVFWALAFWWIAKSARKQPPKSDIRYIPKPAEFPPPPPMPAIGGALLCMKEARRAAERGSEAWNRSQLEDAINSIEFFLAKAKAALADQQPRAEP